MGKLLIPGGGGGADTSMVTATSGDILSGKVIVDKDGNPVNGTMPDYSGTQQETDAIWRDGSNIYMSVKNAGYYPSNSDLKAPASDFGNAAQSSVLSGNTFTSTSGIKIAGTMPDNGAVAPSALAAGGSYTIPAGYHNGSGKVTAQSLATMTASGDATAGEILSGKKAYVDGNLITGTIPTKSGTADMSSKIASWYNSNLLIQGPAGYHPSNNSNGFYDIQVTGTTAASKLGITASKILKGQSIGPISGTATSDATATAAQILSGKTAYVNGSKVTGSLAVTSAISFSAAALSNSSIRISWTNPSKGPWSGVKIRYSTSGYPGVSGGTLTYTGTGSNTSAGGTSYVDITGLAFGKTYYFTCYSYATGLGDSSASYNCTAATSDLILYTKTDGFLNGAYEIGTNRVGYESTNGFMIGKKIVFVTGYELNKPYPIIRARYKKSNGKEETRHCYYAKDGRGYGSQSEEDGWPGRYSVWTVGTEYVFTFSNAWSYFTEKLSEAYLLDANVGGSPYDYGLGNFTKIALRS